MKKDKLLTLLGDYIIEVNKVMTVDKAIIFGSFAKGTSTKNSDIDIAIFSKIVNDENRMDFESKIIMLIHKFKIDIQPIVFSYNDYLDDYNDFVLNEIKKNGMEIYNSV